MSSNTDTGLFRFGGFYRWLVITALVMLVVYAMTGAASVAAITRDDNGVNVVAFTRYEGDQITYSPPTGMVSFWMFSISALPSTLVTFFVIVNILFLHRAQHFYMALILEAVSLIAYFVAPIVITVTTLDYKPVKSGTTIAEMKKGCEGVKNEFCSTFTSRLNTVLALLWVFSLLGLALRAFYIFVLFKAFRAQALNDGQSLRSTDTTTNLSILPTASNAGIKGILHRLGHIAGL